jgi:hypothetical protein
MQRSSAIPKRADLPRTRSGRIGERWRLTRIGAAVEQLEEAIDPLARRSIPLPAIMLAAAAEEMRGNMISAGRAQEQRRDSLAARNAHSPAENIGGQLNATKNWLKHGGADTIDVDFFERLAKPGHRRQPSPDAAYRPGRGGRAAGDVGRADGGVGDDVGG